MEIKQIVLKQDEVLKVLIGHELDVDSQDIVGNVELDIENQAGFVDLLNTLFDSEFNTILLDLQYVNYIDSSGLWALFESHKKASDKGIKFILLSPTKDVLRVLNITKISSKMRVFNDETTALSELDF